jgi:mRNA-degrading endonuclease YafQ of YafQ-DinJ toxin-antitoxin module
MILKYKARFEKTFRRLSANDQRYVMGTVEQIDQFFATRQAPEGLGLKKLFHSDIMGAVCEARVTLALRVLFSVQQDVLTFHMVGDHDDVRRFIRSFQ